MTTPKDTTITEAVATHFLGKIVTVITHATTLPLKDGIAHAEFFSGEVVRVDRFGVYLKHPVLGTLAFYTFPLVGIVEEQHVPKTDPRYEQIKTEVARKDEERRQPSAPKTVVPPNQFVNVAELKQSLAKATAGRN